MRPNVPLCYANCRAHYEASEDIHSKRSERECERKQPNDKGHGEKPGNTSSHPAHGHKKYISHI